MPLRTLVSAEEIALLETSLRWIEAASPRAFSLLFEKRTRGIPAPPPQILAPLLAFDLVERDGEETIAGLLRVRRHAGRFYVLEIGLGNDVEYLQDVWPETDALLAQLSEPCRVLDLGTGCGIVAVEAALRGSRVVATDLYQPTLVLARFNARLNRVDDRIEFREGHLWEPVRGEKFDLVLTNPHYGRSDDQLRLEVLRGAPEHVAKKMVLATALEWDSRGLGIEGVLRSLTDFDVKVEPLYSSYKKDWFTVARGDDRVPSRHRFTISLARGPHRVRIGLPENAPTKNFVPLSRLTDRAVATIATAADVTALDKLLTQLDEVDCTLEHLPAGVLDGCRWGARECVGPRSAAGAICSPDGSIRPCAHGPAVAHADEPLSLLTERYEQLAAAARARRGCDDCPAESQCSRCLFPVALDEKSYCAFVQKHFPVLAAFHRLIETVAELPAGEGALRVRRWPRHGLGLDGVAGEWNRLAVWIVERAGKCWLSFPKSGYVRVIELPREEAELGGALADGSDIDPRVAEKIAQLLA